MAPKAWIRGQVPEDRIRCTSFAGPSPKYDLLKYRVLICRPETRPAAQVALLSPQSVKLQKKEEYCQRKGSKGTRPSSASRPWLHENSCLSEYTHYTVVIFSRCLLMLHRADAAAWPNPCPSPPRLRACFHNREHRHAFIHVCSALLPLFLCFFLLVLVDIRRAGPALSCAAPPISFRRKEAGMGWIRSWDGYTTSCPHGVCSLFAFWGLCVNVCDVYDRFRNQYL